MEMGSDWIGRYTEHEYLGTRNLSHNNDNFQPMSHSLGSLGCAQPAALLDLALQVPSYNVFVAGRRCGSSRRKTIAGEFLVPSISCIPSPDNNERVRCLKFCAV